jgi:hypothetical protein
MTTDAKFVSAFFEATSPERRHAELEREKEMDAKYVQDIKGKLLDSFDCAWATSYSVDFYVPNDGARTRLVDNTDPKRLFGFDNTAAVDVDITHLHPKAITVTLVRNDISVSR